MDGYTEFFIVTFIGALASTLVYPLLLYFTFKDRPDLMWIKKTNNSTPKHFSKHIEIAYITKICIIIAIVITLLMNYSELGYTAFFIVRLLSLYTVPTVAVLLYIKNYNRLIMEFGDNINETNMMSAGKFSLIVFGAFLPVVVTYLCYDNDNIYPEDIPILLLLLVLCVVPIVSTLTYKRNMNKAFEKELWNTKYDSITTTSSFCLIVSSTWLIVLLVWGILLFALMIGAIMSV